MSYEDYSQQELDNIIDEILNVHIGKLKTLEIIFLNQIHHSKIKDEDRDTIVAMYDRMRDDAGE
jgi:hypothetical protein